MNIKDAKVCIIGLGYVGLPLAVEFGKFRDTVGFDINQKRVDELKLFIDSTLEVSSDEMKSSDKLSVSSNIDLSEFMWMS